MIRFLFVLFIVFFTYINVSTAHNSHDNDDFYLNYTTNRNTKNTDISPSSNLNEHSNAPVYSAAKTQDHPKPPKNTSQLSKLNINNTDKDKKKDKVLANELAKTKKSNKLLIYTSRNTDLIQPVIDLYTQKTKETVEIYTASSGMLIEKLKAHKDRYLADLLITVDAGNLWAAKQAGILLAINSKKVLAAVPSHFRDDDNTWFGVSLRARTIMYNESLVAVEELVDYAELASDKFKNRLCLRTSKKVYNQSLAVMLINFYGKEKTQSILKGWVNNLAKGVFSNDTKLIEAIAEGGCHLGIANTYYLARLIKSGYFKDVNSSTAKSSLKQTKGVKSLVKIFWPSNKSTGVHVNISGVGLIKNSKNKQKAIKFIEFLYEKQTQQLFASLNLEYPVMPQVELDPIVKSWQDFEKSKMPLSLAGKLQKDAIILMDKAGYK